MSSSRRWRVLGDPEVPLGQLALGHRRAAALAGALHDLLVGQHGLVLGAPVDEARLAVGQPALAEAQEQPLRPAVVLRVGRVQPPRPVQAQAVAPERRRLGLDVRVRPLGRVRAALDGRVLAGRPKESQPIGCMTSWPVQAQVARHDVAHDERLGVAHVQVAGGVREHVEHVRARLRARPVRLVARDERGLGLPEALPAVLRRDRVVAVGLHAVGLVGGLGLRRAHGSVSSVGGSGHEKAPVPDGTRGSRAACAARLGKQERPGQASLLRLPSRPNAPRAPRPRSAERRRSSRRRRGAVAQVATHRSQRPAGASRNRWCPASGRRGCRGRRTRTSAGRAGRRRTPPAPRAPPRSRRSRARP